MKLVLMGPPGCGKGTQGPAIKERYNVCHLATGDMLRDAVANKTAAGLAAKSEMEAGRLVPDDIVLKILKDGLARPECKHGYIIDGLPRNVAQAEQLEKMGVHPEKVVLLNVPDNVLIERTSGRWLHRASGRTYHERFAPPKVAGKDDVTGEPLMQRNDDKKEVVTKRLKLYHEQLSPIEKYYRQKGIFATVDGNRKASEVREDLFKLLDPLATPQKPWWQFW